MTLRLLLIGAGALGSRHLQSLANGDGVGSVTIVEPSLDSREIAIARWREVEGYANKTLNVFDALTDVTGAYDGCIIATPSSGRLAILDRVMELGVKIILCEKVLFQSVAELEAARAAVRRSGADVRVNHIYRYADAFIELRRRLEGSPLEIDVAIGGGGMGCNLIHYLDLLEFLSREPLSALSVSIEGPLQKSKRGEAYVEFCGRATARTGNGSKLQVSFQEGEYSGPIIRVSTATTQTLIDEAASSVRSDVPEFTTKSFDVPRVSALSLRILNDQRRGQCLLPMLGDSVDANRRMLECFNIEIHGTHRADLVCPIT